MAPRPRESHTGDIRDEDLFLRQPIKDIEDKWHLVPAFLKTRGLVKQHTDSFNYLINTGLQKILKANERHEVDQNFYWQYENIYVGDPELEYSGGYTEVVTPHECRLRDLTYSAPIKVDLVYIKENQKIRKTGQVIGRMPIMLRSDRCVLNNKSDAELYRMKECPLDPGGYFVVRGAEKVVLIQEQAATNRILVELDKTGAFCCKVTSISDEMKTMTELNQKKGKIYVKQNKLKQPGELNNCHFNCYVMAVT